MPAINTDRVTVVLKPRPGDDLSTVLPFLTLGSTVQIGRSGAVVASVADGDVVEHAEQLENQVILAESAMRRGIQLPADGHLPSLQRVSDHVPQLYLAVAEQVKQDALNAGDDPSKAGEAAGQAVRVLMMFKERLEKMLETAR